MNDSLSDYPASYYASAAQIPAPRAPLAASIKADVTVIGGGFTGLSAALHLAEAGASVVLLEAQRFGFAASGRNGGQIHSGFRKDQRELENWLGETRARGLWRLSEDAKALLRGLIAKHKIACALADGVILAAHSHRAARALARDAEHLSAHYGYSLLRMLSAAEVNRTIGTRVYWGGRIDAGGGHLQPLAFALGLARAAEAAGARLHENSAVLSIAREGAGVVARLEGANVSARHAILAADAFTPALAPELAPYLARVDSHIIATEPLPAEIRAGLLTNDAAVADTRHVVDYYRLSPDRRLLFAGGEYIFGAPKNIAAFVRPYMLRVFPQLKNVAITHAWGGTVGITRTRLPHFGILKDRILFGYGYSGQGVALAVLGGKLLAEKALGQSDGFNLLASVPAKRFPGGAALRKPLVKAALLALKLEDKF